MDRAVVDGIALEFEDRGAGEAVICIHGAFVADAFLPLMSEPSLADRYRLIGYRRRGYGDSSPGPQSLVEQADDCRRLLAHLEVRRAHVVGHSFGGVIGLQLALDAPQLVQTLSLLEAGLVVGESGSLYREGLVRGRERYREAGSLVAVEEFLEARWPGYRESLGRLLPGAFEQAVADAPTWFERELPVALDWRFGEAEAQRVGQPVLVVLGEQSGALHSRFAETHRLLLTWLPDAEGVVVPGAAHFMQVERPRAVAGALADFFTRHSLGA